MKRGCTVISNPLEIRDGENRFDYHARLVTEKMKDKSLPDVDYAELSELVYGQQYSSDTARKMMYGSCRTLQLLYGENADWTVNSGSSSIDAKIVEFQKERQRFYDQRREFNKLVSESGRSEHLEDRLVEAAKSLPDTVGSIFDMREREGSFRGDSAAVLVLSDWHYGMIADNIWNHYSKDVCIERVKRIAESAKERILLHGCRSLYIIVLGDLIHGAIHTSARVASEELVVDQIMEVSEILAQTIGYLSGFVESTMVCMTYGNHARVVPDKKDNIHRDNYERLIPWWIKQRLSGTGIQIDEPSDNEFITKNIMGFGFCATHGDLDSVKSSPRLIGTLFHKKYGVDIDYVIVGDKHHSERFSELGIESMLCGSLCGTDEYANSKRLYDKPSQLLMIVDQENGVDAEYSLKC